MIDTSKMPNEVKGMYDAIRVTIKFARWAYLSALDEGFTETKAMQVANTYVQSMLAVGANSNKMTVNDVNDILIKVRRINALEDRYEDGKLTADNFEEFIELIQEYREELLRKKVV